SDSAPAASPSVPLTQTSSPGLAPSRRRACPGATSPCAATDTASGPRVVSPPTRATRCSAASATKPSRKPSTHAGSPSGSDSDKVHHAGSAPMAARSDRFTARAFQPMSEAAVPEGKCTPSLRVSIVTTSCRPGGGCSRAASSPIPSTTSSRACAARSRMRSISLNSAMAMAAGSAAGRLHFGRAPLGGGVVEHAVDIGVAVLGAEALDGLQGLVDHHPVGHVDAVAQLVGGDAQHGALDRIDFGDPAVEEGLQRGVQVATVGFHAAHQVLEVLEVGDFLRLLVRELGDGVARVHARQLHRVHRLQRAPARARAPHGVDAAAAAAATLRPHGSVPSRLAISIATRAHSSPLLPWLPPARFSASTTSSTASTPLATGTPWSSWTRARPSAQLSATCSK